MKRTVVAIALVPLALLAACGTQPGTSTGASTVSVTPSASSPSTSEAPSGTPSESEAPSPTATAPVEVKHQPDKAPLVKGVRFAGHQGYDRVVIDLQGAVPGYRVRWVDELVEEGSGETIKDVKGGAYLQVRLEPANAHTEQGKTTWDEPVLRAKLPNLGAVVRTGDFEGVVTLALVLDHRAGFRVTEGSDPSRLVIDVAH